MPLTRKRDGVEDSVRENDAVRCEQRDGTHADTQPPELVKVPLVGNGKALVAANHEDGAWRPRCAAGVPLASRAKQGRRQRFTELVLRKWTSA